MAEFLQHPGRVYLVGAGPGDPGLITMRGVECLRRADLILYDYLINPQLLAHAGPHSQRICLGRHGQGRLWSQAEINAKVVAAAQAGQTVVRLKSGDPLIFGRSGEEIAALTAAGIPFEIVPGITAALAVGSYAGFPLTHRDCASAVALITGQEQVDKDSTDLDYSALAKFPGTLVFYMGVTTVRHWSQALLAAGKSASTPALIVRRCSWTDQTTVPCTLGTVAAEMERLHLRPPVLVVVGAVAGQAPVASWFEQRPLFGQRVLITRPVEQSLSLAERLQELGAECVVQPVIEIGPPPDVQMLDNTLRELGKYAWIVFSSANGVRACCERLLQIGCDLRSFGAAKIAVMGPGTADELAKFHLHFNLQPREFRAEALAAELAPLVKNQKVLLIRASRGREVLAEQLATAGAHVEQVVAYTSQDIREPHPEVASDLSSGKFAWVTVTSSAIARSLVRLFGAHLHQTKLVSISPITSATLRELGFEPTAEAKSFEMEGLVQAMLGHSAD